MLHRPQMTLNHDPALVTLLTSTLEHTFNHFLEFWIFEGVKHFLGLLNPQSLQQYRERYEKIMQEFRLCDVLIY